MDAPANAATGSTCLPASASGRYAIESVAPSPAPAATPRRYGSASGLWNTPWYVAPAIASIPPTSPASRTRGTRRSQTIDSCVASSGDVTPGMPSFSPSERSTSPTPMWTGPATTPTTSATARNATAATAQPGVTPRTRIARAVAAAASTLLPSEPPERRADRTDEIDEPRPPARRDRVVEADDRPRADRRDPRPARPCRDRPRVLRTAHRVREHDQGRVRRDQVLRRELRVLGTALHCVGDVPQAEQGVD